VARFGVVDVHYPASGAATAALVVAGDITFSDVIQERIGVADEVAPYEPGFLYRRELPPLLALLETGDPLDVVVVDGFVDLDPAGMPGLGRHLHNALGVPVIGVAKSRYRTATHAARVTRGTATRPLYVTTVGVALDEAVRAVEHMDGPHRIPRAFRRVDALARALVHPVS
jgi:deoxyribonuclease V